MSDKEFRAELAALLKKFPEQARGFSVELSSSSAEEATGAAVSTRCVRYGRDPETGELICLEYARTDS